MDLAELRKLRPALDRFTQQFDDCIKTTPSRTHLRTYLNGQLGPLKRKSIEPIALDARVPPRTLQEFFSIHRWDEVAVGKRLRKIIKRDHGDPNGIAILDEGSYKKKGVKTAGVQRQYCGNSGKTENCVVTVHLAYAAGDFHGPLDQDLYLPEETWSEDRERCREAGIPEDVVYRPKWQIGLDLLDRSLMEGIPISWFTADEAYGRVRALREALTARGINYVMEIPASLTGWTKKPTVEPEGTVVLSGRTLKKPRIFWGQEKARKVSKIWKRGGRSWKRYKVKTTDKGPMVWEVRETRFFPNNGGVPGEEERLLIAREVLSGEVKYFLAKAPGDVPLGTLLFVAFSRWRIERLFEDAKGEVGLHHFEVRNYRSLMRHLVLSNLSIYFLYEQTDRLREKKSGVDSISGEDGGGGTAGSDDAAA
jgi:SRSO17 transposase